MGRGFALASVGRKQRSAAERSREGEGRERRGDRGEERGMRESARLVLERESLGRGGGDATGEQADGRGK